MNKLISEMNIKELKRLSKEEIKALSQEDLDEFIRKIINFKK